MPTVDMSGQRFGRLTALRTSADQTRGKPTKWLCRCDCGKTKDICGAKLRKGDVVSCGCFRLAGRAPTHGCAGPGKRTAEYLAWGAMIQRCCNPRSAAYPRYGGRGITICAEWRNSFETFLADMGPRPSRSHSIDRIDNDLGYEPSNCRWATRREQNNNLSKTVFVDYGGQRTPLSFAAEMSGIHIETLRQRMARGLRGGDLFAPSNRAMGASNGDCR